MSIYTAKAAVTWQPTSPFTRIRFPPFSSSGWETSRLKHNLTENGIGQAETPDCAGRIQLTRFQFDRDPAPTKLTHVLAS